MAAKQKRTLDSELNLIPFINILAMCICFLLMTAVWFQVTAVPVKQSHGTEGAASQGASYDLEVTFVQANQVRLDLLRAGRRQMRAALKADTVEELLPKMDATLTSWLQKITPKNAKPSFKPGTLITTGMITPRKGVSYGHLVAALDVLRNHDIVNLGVVPVGEN